MLKDLICQINNYLDSLPENERIESINTIRQAIHTHSPFKRNPIDCILWIKQEKIIPNNYNPNSVAPQERKLLEKSIKIDGFTQPIVVYPTPEEERFEIVDGFHRYDIIRRCKSLNKMLNGYLPVSCLAHEATDSLSRMASTVRHNRARGRHQISAMSDIVCEMALQGWDEKRIGAELGMDCDEVLRLRQVSGLLQLFADRNFSLAWTID